MNSGVLTKGLQLDPVTTTNSRTPEDHIIWVLKILAFIISIYLVSLRIFFITTIYSLSVSEGIISKICKNRQDAIKIGGKFTRTKNSIFQYISNKLSTWDWNGKEDKKTITNNLYLIGLKVMEKDNRCMDPDGKDLWCMTKYKPIAKKVRPVNQAMPQSLNPPLQRPPLTRDPYKTPLTPHPPEFKPTWKITEERLGVISFGPKGWLSLEELKLFKHIIVLRQGASAFCPEERGLLKHSYGLPYVIPVIKHEPCRRNQSQYRQLSRTNTWSESGKE